MLVLCSQLCKLYPYVSRTRKIELKVDLRYHGLCSSETCKYLILSAHPFNLGGLRKTFKEIFAVGDWVNMTGNIYIVYSGKLMQVHYCH